MRRLAFSLLLGLLAVPSWSQASRDFDGSNDLVDCGDINSLEGIDNLTAFAWARLDDNDTTAAGIFGKTSSGANTWVIRKNADETLSWRVNAGGDQVATGATPFTIGQWFCAVATYDRSLGSSRLKIYLNGVQDGAANGADGAVAAAVTTVRAGVNVTIFWDGQVAHAGAEARTWSAGEVAEYCSGNLAIAQRAAGGTGGYLPLWDNAADPGTYTGQGVFSGACSSSTDPAVSSDGPPVFIPGGGN